MRIFVLENLLFLSDDNEKTRCVVGPVFVRVWKEVPSDLPDGQPMGSDVPFYVVASEAGHPASKTVLRNADWFAPPQTVCADFRAMTLDKRER